MEDTLTSVIENSEWFAQQNLAQYLGQWVAVVGRKVVAAGQDLAKVLKETQAKFPNEVPYVTAVPKGTLVV